MHALKYASSNSVKVSTLARPQKPSQVDRAYGELKADILANRLPAGFQAPEPEIAERLGMSRTPVREALLRLQSDGLIELIPRRGAKVLPISFEDMREIYEILTALEPEAAAGLAARSDKDPIFQALNPTVLAMEQALAEEDLEAWALADEQFHLNLLHCHNNHRMTAILTALIEQSQRVRLITLRLRETPHRSTQEHREILDHIMAGRADRARESFRAHRKRAAEELLTILQDYKFPAL